MKKRLVYIQTCSGVGYGYSGRCASPNKDITICGSSLRADKSRRLAERANQVIRMLQGYAKLLQVHHDTGLKPLTCPQQHQVPRR
jgi:hypothetical protein